MATVLPNVGIWFSPTVWATSQGQGEGGGCGVEADVSGEQRGQRREGSGEQWWPSGPECMSERVEEGAGRERREPFYLV